MYLKEEGKFKNNIYFHNCKTVMCRISHPVCCFIYFMKRKGRKVITTKWFTDSKETSMLTVGLLMILQGNNHLRSVYF